MKSFPLFLLTSFAVCGAVLGDAGFPKDVYRQDDLEKAKAEAAAKGKPLAIFYTLEKTTCPSTVVPNQRAIKELHGKAVMVYFDASPGGYDKLPGAARTAFNAPETNVGIPKIAIFDANMGKTIALVGDHTDSRDLDKAYRDALKKIHDATGGTGGATAGSSSFDETFKKK